MDATDVVWEMRKRFLCAREGGQAVQFLIIKLHGAHTLIMCINGVVVLIVVHASNMFFYLESAQYDQMHHCDLR